MDVLSVGVAVIGKFGYVSKTKSERAYAEGRCLTTTHNRVWAQFNDRKIKDEDRATVTQEDADLAAAIIAWVATLEGTSDYEHNLKVIFAQERFQDRQLGFAVSAIGSYKRHIAWTTEKEIRDREWAIQHADKIAHSAYVGEIKKRELFTLTLLSEKEIGGEWGLSTPYKFATPEGQEVVWFSSGSHNLKVGETYKVKATVKRHDEFKGIKQTLITRAAVQS